MSNRKSPVIAQSNHLTEARYSLTVAEQRFVLTILSFISPDDEDFREYEIKVLDFKEMLGINTNAVYEQFRETLRKLASRVIYIPKSDNGKDYLIVNWFSSAEYDSANNSVKISFDKKLKPYLLQLKEQFTKYKLFIIAQFKSIYTIRIYMLLKQYESIGFREFDLERLKYILGVEAASYNDFKRFRARVLNQAKKEFEAKNKTTGCCNSDITFDLETIRTGRKITRLRFIIKKQTYQEQLPIDLPEPEEKLPAVLALERYGISELLAKQFTDEQGEKDILRCVALYERKLKEGRVKDKSGGYLVKMLQAKAGKQTEADKIAEVEAKKKQQAKAQEAKQKKREEEQEKLAKAFREKAINKFLSELSAEEQENLLQQAKQENPLLSSSMKSLKSATCLAFLLPKIPNFEKNKQAYIAKHLK